MEDWRLRGQEEYLSHAMLCKVQFPEFWQLAYETKSPFYQKIDAYAKEQVQRTGKWAELLEGEKVGHFWHEHCEFCWEKAYTHKACEFYCTEDMYYWICAECFKDFAEKFHWRVKAAEELLGQPTTVESIVCLIREQVCHHMNLHSSPFEKIKSGEKTIELRLFDEKRQKINPGDKITFTNNATGETLTKTVVKLHRFDSFEDLYKALPLLLCGYTAEDIVTAHPSDMEQYYCAEEQKKYGVVGIELC